MHFTFGIIDSRRGQQIFQPKDGDISGKNETARDFPL
jgi:hypothetical protein